MAWGVYGSWRTSRRLLWPYTLSSPCFSIKSLTCRVGPAMKRGEGAVQGKPAVILSLQKQPGANTLTLTQALDTTLTAIQRTLPDGMRLNAHIFRQADFIAVAIENVVAALQDGVLVVVGILLLFLLNLRATLITLVAIPLSPACRRPCAASLRRHDEHDDPGRHGHCHWGTGR